MNLITCDWLNIVAPHSKPIRSRKILHLERVSFQSFCIPVIRRMLVYRIDSAMYRKPLYNLINKPTHNLKKRKTKYSRPSTTLKHNRVNKCKVSSYNNNEKTREFNELRQLLQTKTPH